MTSLSSVLHPTDSSEAIHFFRTLVPGIGALWKARNQAKHIEAVENSLGTDPITLRALHRKYKSFSPPPIKEPTGFYGVRLGHVPGVYTSWKEAQPHTIGIRSDFKRFKTCQKTEAYVAQHVTLGQTPLFSPDAVFYTAVWGVHLTRTSAPPV